MQDRPGLVGVAREAGSLELNQPLLASEPEHVGVGVIVDGVTGDDARTGVPLRLLVPTSTGGGSTPSQLDENREDEEERAKHVQPD